jgi:excisionase family DNA binding protein
MKSVEAHSSDVVIGAGVLLSPAACEVLHRLAQAGVTAALRADGGGSVPPGTAALISMLRAGARLDAGRGAHLDAIVDSSTAPLGLEAVQAAASRHELTTHQAADQIGWTPSYLRRLARNGDIPGARKHGQDWRIPRRYVDHVRGPAA